MKLAIVLGTRPEIIKMSPVIKECVKQKLDYFILHTGQHYSYNMDDIFFEQLMLPKPKYNLNVGSGSYSEEISRMRLGVGRIFEEEKPDIMLIEGDTNTCIAATIAAVRCGVMVGHIEAGLRSYYSGMPEEINRVIIDHFSTYLFAPTNNSLDNLLSEGIAWKKVFVVGNTIVDALKDIKFGNDMANILGYKQKEYALVTLHRQENVDNKYKLADIIKGLNQASEVLNIPIIYPIHPRTKKMIERYNIDTGRIHIIEPPGYFNFVQLENGAKIIFTDSGGVQEEACVLGIPCVTLRDNTERPETLEIDANMLAGSDKIVECAKLMVDKSGWEQPFGDGDTGVKIVDIIRRY
jgi:UDP-N-acetylglucosamine 2-epimerase (non-hydrolysing)